MLILIAATAKNGIMGHNNALPWHLPEDLAFFKRTTMGHPVIMGRNTWESLKRPLPGRLNVVVSTRYSTTEDLPYANVGTTSTAQNGKLNTQVCLANSLPAAIERVGHVDTAFIIGGANVYAQALQLGVVDELILTELHADFEGDTTFPEFDKTIYVETKRESHPATQTQAIGYDWVWYRNTST